MDMQHREHSKHNEYTYGWIFIQEIYLITCLDINIKNKCTLKYFLNHGDRMSTSQMVLNFVCPKYRS